MASPAASKSSTSAGVKYDGGLTCSIQVKDLAKSIAFYQDVMGFKMIYHIKEMAWCELSTAVARVNVGLSEVEHPAKLSGTKLTFGVSDIDASRAFLESKGVKFDGETQTIPGMVKLATFFDPTGNALMFYQDLQNG